MRPEPFLLDPLLAAFLREDLGHGDLSAEAIFEPGEMGAARFTAREPLVAVGMASVCARVFRLLDPAVAIEAPVADGVRVAAGATLLSLRGPVLALLRGERVALNLAQRLCAIATLTAAYVEAASPHPARIVDTRKTTPGLRLLEKYAVRTGGGHNHRYNLSDGVLIKDNHIAACGSIAQAVELVRAKAPHTIRVEVECDTLAQARECLDCRVEVIMLDNMDPLAMREAVALIGGRALVEASGGVSLDNVAAIAATGVDLISVGRLTHSAPAVDIGMDWM